jgi:hypothetical protein
MRSGNHIPSRRSGSALVEFAFIALVLYFLLAFIIEFGRIFYSAQAVQSAADVAARELAKVPLNPTAKFVDALEDPVVLERIYNPTFLVVDLALIPDGAITQYFTDNAPILNQMLLPLMIVDYQEMTDGSTRRLLRYPGRIVPYTGAADSHLANPDQLTVNIQMVAIDANGNEVIDPIPLQVVEEIVSSNQSEGPFSLSTGVPIEQRGMVALRINYPYQAATLASYPAATTFPPDPNIGNEVIAPEDSDGRFGPNAGSDGLGRLAVMGKQVRPFRKVLTAQAFARRELFALPSTTP